MFLKSIDIAGFKSFARPVRIELTPGITALVGSNGSGKSNIVDAIRWALGEQSMRDLRGQRAEDVIHAGPTRSLGAAEVTLTFESADPEDGFPAGIAISRRLYRSGESEYLLNRRRVRLRDVQDALRSIGIDGGRNTVVNQGMTDALLAATPAERRVVLEQAAGLSGYRTRRDEARQKLATTAENMQTMELVLSELEPRLRSLRRQVKVVRDRDDAVARLRVQLLRWYGWHWRAGTLAVERQIDMVALSRENRERAEAELRGLEELTELAANEERAWRARIETLTAAVYSAEREHDSADFRQRATEQQLRTLRTQLVELRERALPLQRLAMEADEAMRIGMLARSVLEEDEANAQNALAQAQHEHRAKTEELDALRTEVARRRRDLATLERENARLNERTAGLQKELNTREERLGDLEAQMATVSAAAQTCDAQISDTAIELQAARSHEQRAQAAFAAANASFQGALDRRRRCDRLRARIRAALVDLERRTASASHYAEELATHVGAMMAHVEVVEGWEQAAAAALGPWTSLLSLRRREDGWTGDDQQLFLFWRANLTIMPGIWADEVIAGMPADTIDPLAGTVLVDDQADAAEIWRRIADQRACRVKSPPLQIVTRNGIVVSALGTETGCQDDRTARYLEARRLAIGLRNRVPVLAGRLTTIESLGSFAITRSNECQAVAEAARADAAPAEERSREIGAQLDTLRRRRAHMLEDHARWGASAETIKAETEEVLVQAHEAMAGHDQSLIELELFRQTFTKIEERLRVEVDASRALQQQVSEARHTLDLVHQRGIAHRAALASAEETARRARQEMTVVSERMNRLEGEFELREAEFAAQASTAQDLAAVLVEQRTSLKQSRESTPTPSPELKSLEAPRRRLTQLVSQHESALAQLRQAQAQQLQLAKETELELGLRPEEVSADVESPPAEDELRRLRQRANQYSEAGEAVIAECAEIETRYQSLKSHLDDLSAASIELQSIMMVADREMQSRFEVSFGEVNEEFGRVFEVMLRGGHARLEELDADGGIGIRAQLPGKRAHSSASFSGGERALVATSLLFGILRMRPTPFCVLDEVDAALDEGNVDRYLEALRDVSGRTQIIVVTHNRATMAASAVLYGVTMDTEGVSSLLSLRLDAFTAAV